jgi:hypothetical protein
VVSFTVFSTIGSLRLAGLGCTVTLNAGDGSPTHESFAPLTVIKPEMALVAKSIIINCEFSPYTIEVPFGSVHKYLVTLGIGGIE